eukprot:m.91742 g.91742  ORF g.91742 m.91742 type:complete len:221 (-) comp14911_c0_seq3:99-761(-)
MGCCCSSTEEPRRNHQRQYAQIDQHERERLIATPPPGPYQANMPQLAQRNNDGPQLNSSRAQPRRSSQRPPNLSNHRSSVPSSVVFPAEARSAPARHDVDHRRQSERMFLAFERAQAQSFQEELQLQQEQEAEEDRQLMELTARHSVLESLPLTLFTPEVEQDGQPNECAICMDELALGDRVRYWMASREGCLVVVGTIHRILVSYWHGYVTWTMTTCSD